MKNLILISILPLVGCTYNLNMIQTEGTASDVVDDITTPSTTVTAEIPLVKK